jgi:tetratricopeptide (TPR) repeat protein
MTAKPASVLTLFAVFKPSTRVGNPDIMVMARWSHAVASWGRGDHEEAVEIATRAIELSENDPTVGTDLLTFRPHFFFREMRMGSLSYMGRRAEAAKDAAAFDSKEPGLDRYSFYMPMSWLVIYHWLSGDFRTGLAAILRAREELRDYAVPPAEVFHYQMLGIAHTLVEEWQEAKSALEQSLAISVEHRAFLQQAGETSAWLARVYAELGEFDKAREAAAESERAGKHIGSIRTTSTLHFARARTAWKSGGAAARDEIELELAAGLRAAQDVGARLLEPYFHLEWATLYGACGEAERSREQLERAHALFVSMDSERNAERVARRLEAASA